MKKRKFGIIMSCYNNSPYIRETVQSCLDQDYTDLEIVIADDGSTDNTLSDIYEISGSSENMHVLELEHKERGAARKAALEKAKTLGLDFIFIIDSDMVLKQKLVSSCIRYLDENHAVGALIIPEIAYSEFNNFFSKVKVFERNIINNAGEDIGENSIEAARLWRIAEYEKSGGINFSQISFEETQPTIRYVSNGGVIKRATFTGVFHNEKKVTLKNLISKKRYYFSVMNKTIDSEKDGLKKALSRWYFFRPVLYRLDNIKRYLLHPILTIGMMFMYFALSFVGVYEIIRNKSS